MRPSTTPLPTVPRNFCGSCGGPILTAGPGPCADCWAPRPAWDTRCVRGCGAVVLDEGDVCAVCTEIELRLAWSRTTEAFRKEFPWAWEREARDA